jgi:hypothetical protein
MIYLNAESVGERVRLTPFQGVVHSLFDRACNVCDTEGLCMVLVSPELGHVPHGIRVELPTDASFAQLLRQGQPVGLRGGVLRMGGAVAVDVRGAWVWRAGVQGIATDLALPAQRRAWRTARHVVSELVAAQPAWLEGLWQRLPDSPPRDLTPLIGYGPGLTPAGDDFVVGYLAGLWSSVPAGQAPATRVHALAVDVLHAAESTTAVSRSYLYHAAQGYVAEPLRTLAIRIATGANEASTQAATRAACAVGATSGVCGVLGLLCGLVANHPSAHSCGFTWEGVLPC